MPGRSRYASHYGEFQQYREPVSLDQAGIVGADSHFLNIANGQCGKVEVRCWPIREGVEGGRQWGKLKSMDALESMDAAIMPFKTKAGTIAPNVKIETFELELFLCDPDAQDFRSSCFPKVCNGRCPHPHAAIVLTEQPAPEQVTSCMTTISSDDAAVSRPWEFGSEDIQDCDGRARAARWKWDAHGHKPVTLHGGMAFTHVARPFVVACRVRGRAFAELPTQRVRLRYQYSNEENTPKWWIMIPQQSSEDLYQHVRQLEVTMQNLNTKPRADPPAPAVSGINRSQSHNFGASMISGPAHVVMGDVNFGYNSNPSPNPNPNPNPFQQVAGWQQFNPSAGTGMLS